MTNTTPAVIFKLSFLQSENRKWHIGAHDLLDYMDKPEKFLVKGEQVTGRQDFLDYMSNPDKSLGVFDDKTDVYSDVDKEKFRALEHNSKEQGCPKYVGVLSFNNNFLEVNGYMHNGILDDERMRNVARAAIAEMIDKSKKLDSDNVYYAASIHKNTDNIHVHYSVLEYEFREDRTVTYKNAGQNSIELEAIFAAKSKAANMIAAKKNKAQYEELNRLQRELLLPKLSTSYSNTTADIYNLAVQLPADKHWQYNRPRMRQYHTAINSCIDSIINSTPELKKLWHEYNASLNSMQEYSKYLYGEGDLHLYSGYKVKRLQDFYSRAGQSLLNYIKTTDLSQKVSLDTIDDIGEPEAYLSEEETVSEFATTNYYIDADEAGAHLSEEKITDNVQHIRWSRAYKTAIEYFYGTDELEQDIAQAYELFLDEHNNGNLLATYMLGKIHSVQPYYNEYKSKEYYRKAHEGMTTLIPLLDDRKKKLITYKLGTMANYGLGIEQNYELAFKYFTDAGNYPYALNALGKLYQYGYGVEKSDEEAFRCFQRAYLSDVKKRMPHNIYTLARCYELGKGVTANNNIADEYYKEAFSYFKDSAEKRTDDYTLYRLGHMCYAGKGTGQDIPSAIEYLKQSAENGNAPAHLLLGKIYIEAEDYDTAIAYLSAEPVSDNEYALYSISKLLYSQAHYDEAVKYLHRSADAHNNQYAQYALGKHFLSDRFYDEKNAEHYLLRSAMQDNEYGQYALGKLYLKQGHINEAIEWLHKAADEHGNEFAQLQLGTLYYTYKYGISLHDSQKGEYYLKLSAGQGNEIAAKLLKTTFRPKGAITGRKRPRFDTISARADLAKATHIADSVYAEMMAHLAQLQREFELENNIVEDNRSYTY